VERGFALCRAVIRQWDEREMMLKRRLANVGEVSSNRDLKAELSSLRQHYVIPDDCLFIEFRLARREYPRTVWRRRGPAPMELQVAGLSTHFNGAMNCL